MAYGGGRISALYLMNRRRNNDLFPQVPDKNKLLLHYPASWWRNMWREALPAGNGEIGAAVYGAIHKETVLINHSDLWHLGVKGTLPDVSHSLQETRNMM